VLIVCKTKSVITEQSVPLFDSRVSPDAPISAATAGVSDVALLGFALSDCVVELDAPAARYLRAVHRTALELAVQNGFGIEVGGFWLMQDQIAGLRALADHYPACESEPVARAIEAYLRAQLLEMYQIAQVSSGVE
jgi:hypothetical protein